MDLVTVGSFPTSAEAALAKNLLETEGVPSFIEEDATGDLFHLTSPFGEVPRGLDVRNGVKSVDFGTSALASAIHNTGHYHVRLGPVCLAPSCARIRPRSFRRSVTAWKRAAIPKPTWAACSAPGSAHPIS